jgi:ribose 1,5-bisphosphate isomerase
MRPELEKRIAAIAGDRESGASEILVEASAILREASQEELAAVAQALRAAQPSMAPLRNATAAALTGDLELFAQRMARAPQAIARYTAELLETGLAPAHALRIVTISYSGTVAHALEFLAARRRLEVACAEGRPALEGRRLAARLARAGMSVTCFADAALAHGLERADAVLVGADAVGSEWFVNKSGTRMLAAAAGQAGIASYVLAGREKFIGSVAASTLELKQSDPAEVWDTPPSGVTVKNAYFECIPLELVAATVTDIGVLSSVDVVELCGQVGDKTDMS